MKKKHIIQIIIGIIIIVGIGYAIYSEIERNKEDYFVIETKLGEEKIGEVLKGKDFEKIHEWSHEIKKVKFNYMKIKTKITTYEGLKNEKGISIEYVDRTGKNGCKNLKKDEWCEISFSVDMSDTEYAFFGEVEGSSKEKIFKMKKHPKIKEIIRLKKVPSKADDRAL